MNSLQHQILICKQISNSFEKAYSEGIYSDTPQNRKMGRVGQRYSEKEGGATQEYENKESSVVNKPVEFKVGEEVKVNGLHGTIKSFNNDKTIAVVDVPTGRTKGYYVNTLEKWGETNDTKLTIENIKLDHAHAVDIYIQGAPAESGLDIPIIDKAGKVLAYMQKREESFGTATEKYAWDWSYKSGEKSSGRFETRKEAISAFLKEHTLRETINLKDKLNSIEETTFEESKNEYEIGTILNKNGKIIFKKSGNKTSIQLDPYVLDQLKDTIFTHNHPNGRCFSLADLSTAISYGVKEMRAAVTNSYYGKGTFVFKKGNLEIKDHNVFVVDYRKSEDYVSGELISKINKADTPDKVEETIDLCNQIHHIEILKQLFKDKKYKNENIEFYFERKKGEKLNFI